MKNLSELSAYYQNVLLPELRPLEEQRKKALAKIILIAAFILPLSFVLAMAMPPLIVLGIVIIVWASAAITKTYVSNFKTNIIEKIVTAIDDNLHYYKERGIEQSLFSASGIFKQHIDHYHAEDYVQGVLGKTKVEFSEIHAQYITRDGKGRTSYHTIFRGLFFIADFNKNFNGKTVVLPDTAERLFGVIGNMLQSWNIGRGELVKLEDPEFEKEFVVYASDQIEARYILSMSLMKRIVDFKRKTRKNIYLSFVGSKIFIALPCYRNLFEPRIFRTVLDFSSIRQYFEDLQLAVGIVEDLNLNTRIWTKQ